MLREVLVTESGKARKHQRILGTKWVRERNNESKVRQAFLHGELQSDGCGPSVL